MKIYKVLLAEDDLASAKVITHTLKKHNFIVTHVENGRDAASIANEKTFDLVITDINMPFMDGFQFLEASKAALKTTSVIMLTAVGDREKVVKATSYNVQMFLLKPINPSKLVEKISEALKLKPEHIVTKKDFPFIIDSHFLEGNGLEIILSGIPLQDFTEDVLSLIRNYKSKTKFLHFRVDKELFYFPDSLLVLDTILFKVHKELSLQVSQMHVHGSFFDVVSKFDPEEYRILYQCRISEFY